MKNIQFLVFALLFSCGQKSSINDAPDNNGALAVEYCTGDLQIDSHGCLPCEPGTAPQKSSVLSATFDRCESIRCLENEYVVSNMCLDCPEGLVNDAGDDASGNNTQCIRLVCELGQQEYNDRCYDCPAGTEPAAQGEGVECMPVLCNSSQHVVNNQCVSCPGDRTNTGGDDASGEDTLCDPLVCGEGRQGFGDRCYDCLAGNELVEEYGSVRCRSVFCSPSERVLNNQCVACPESYVSGTQDVSATQPDTECSIQVGDLIDLPPADDSEFDDACLNAMSNQYQDREFNYGGHISTGTNGHPTEPGYRANDSSALLMKADLETREAMVSARLSFSDSVAKANIYSGDCSTLHFSKSNIGAGIRWSNSEFSTLPDFYSDNNFILVFQVPHYSEIPIGDEDYNLYPATRFYTDYVPKLDNGESCYPSDYTLEGEGVWSCENFCDCDGACSDTVFTDFDECLNMPL